MAARRKKAAPRQPRKFVAFRCMAVPLIWPDGSDAGWGVWDFDALRIAEEMTGAFAKSRAVKTAQIVNGQAS